MGEAQRAVIIDSGRKYLCPRGHKHPRSNNLHLYREVPHRYRKDASHEEPGAWYHCIMCSDFYKIGQQNQSVHNHEQALRSSQKDRPSSLLEKSAL